MTIESESCTPFYVHVLPDPYAEKRSRWTCWINYSSADSKEAELVSLEEKENTSVEFLTIEVTAYIRLSEKYVPFTDTSFTTMHLYTHKHEI